MKFSFLSIFAAGLLWTGFWGNAPSERFQQEIQNHENTLQEVPYTRRRCRIGPPRKGSKKRSRVPRCKVTRSNQVSIVLVEAFDQGDFGSGSAASQTIDTLQGDCNPDDPGTDLEPFFDTVLVPQLQNDLPYDLRVKQFTYTVHNADGNGKNVRSKRLGPSGGGYLPKSEEPTSVPLLFTRIEDGQKFFTGSSEAIPAFLGIRNVTLRIWVQDPFGNYYFVSQRVALSFNDTDRC